MASTAAKSAVATYGLLLVGIAFLLGTGWTAGSHIAFLNRATLTEARIVDLHVHYDSSHRNRPAAFPIYEFALPDGGIQRSVGPVGATRGCCKVGDVVRLNYDPANPRRVARPGFTDGWALPTALGCFAAFWMAMWGLWVWMGVREARSLHATVPAGNRGRVRRQDGELGPGGMVVALSVIIGVFVLGAVAAALTGFPGLAVVLVGFGLVWLVLGWLVVRDQM